ncbi:MAG: C40 family peptidase [Deltaproteobacteria bacterium]|nr:C40 family peptidase [Deltaproteobacteria bacterium]
MIRSAIFIILFGYALLMTAEASEYGVARVSAPVLNTPDFKSVFGGAKGKTLKVDRCGQVRELEYIAMPGTLFTISKKQHSGTVDVYQVETDEYSAPPNVRLHVEGRFLKLERTAPAPRKPVLPPREEILSALRSSAGSPYVWGGNVTSGVPELAAWFYKDISEADRGRLTLAGLDCSGLLYHATGGWTPRNTSQLTSFGQGVAITGKQSIEIASLLQPLDLIVWNGHVIIVLDSQTAIESRLACGKPGGGGVVMTPLSQRIAEIMHTRSPTNTWPVSTKHENSFVVRRWYGQ